MSDPNAQTAPWITRILVGIAGLGLAIGFFLPWVNLGGLLSMSGLSIALAGGQAVEALSGPSRALIFVVPLSGVLLALAAIRGLRMLPWIALANGFLIFAVGIFTLIRVFIDSTGMGMWVVALSTLLALVGGLASSRR